jgi:peroxiredoxin (alkyl hydroperoxide reductase subunit C)
MQYCKIDRKQGGLGPVEFPLLSDPTHSISKAFGCYVPSQGIALRATYIIDLQGIVRHISVNDLPVGRCPAEILRLV